MLKIAIVILNWNGKDLLNKFLPSIIRYSDPEIATIYLVDNNSSDDSIAFVKNNFSEVKIIKNISNLGYAGGYNLALQQVNEPILALVNSDIEVTPNWLQPILNTFKTELNTAIIQPKILDYKDKSKFEYAGAGGGFIDKYGYPFCRGRIFNQLEPDNNQFNDVIEIFWASGACFFIRNSVFKELNGFDADFFAHQEEIDLCWRANNSGYTVKYNGKSTVYHIGGATLNEGLPRKTFLNFRNSLCMLSKNLPKESLLSIVFTRLMLDGIAGIQFLFKLKPLHTFAIIKAHFFFYALLPKMLKKRNQQIKEKNYFHTKSIVFNHFVKNVNRFENI